MYVALSKLTSIGSFIINWRRSIISATGLCLFSLNSLALPQSQSCFYQVKIEPAFIAFTASKNSQLGAWYKKTFDLETVKEFAFPDGSVTGILMRKEEFIVEVFYRDEVHEKIDYAPKSKTEQWTGVMKSGFYVNADLIQLKQCLLEQGVQATRIWQDKKLGIDLLQVIDPNKNVLEIIQRRVE